MKTHKNLFDKIISIENLFDSWYEFRVGKRKRCEVLLFEHNLGDNLFALYEELKNKTYTHSQYTAFYVTDPKLRFVHKAEVRDRVVHHAIYRVLYPIFDLSFVYDSYSCRIDKGTHRAVSRLEKFVRKVSKNFACPCFVLKCDIKKFFSSVDHKIIIGIIEKMIDDLEAILLIKNIIDSFNQPVAQSAIFDLPSANRERERERERESGGRRPLTRKASPSAI